MEDIRAGASPPSFSNEIFGMFIESLEDDQSSLRACSLVSSTFRHFCNPILYRDIELDREETVDAFIQDGARSDFLQHIKSLSLTYYGFMSKAHRHKPNRILHVALRKASLDALRLHKIHFQAEPFAASIMSKLSTVTVLVLHGCLFEGICDFISFIRCFPRCEVLRLRGCHWIPRAKPESGGQPSYDVAPTHLEITNTSIPYGRSDYRDQGGIVGMAWLDLTGLKSFTYTFEDDIPSERVFGGVAASEHLEEINVAIARSEPRDSAIIQLTPLVARIKFLTLRCDNGLFPWWEPSYTTEFPPSPTLEWVRIVSKRTPTIEDCEILDTAFSDTDRYPSLRQLEVCSPPMPQDDEKREGTYGSPGMDARFPRLSAMKACCLVVV